jgi:hypothetical protein
MPRETTPAAVRLDPANTGARNNLAQALLDLGCPRLAREQLATVKIEVLASPLREAVMDTRRNIDAAAGASPVSDPEQVPYRNFDFCRHLPSPKVRSRNHLCLSSAPGTRTYN